MEPYFTDDAVTLYHGKALEIAAQLADGSADCIVTSPPYFGLRDYGVEGQYGLEDTPEEYVANQVTLYRELRRVLADDGTFWLNIGDSYGRGSRPIAQPAQSFEKGRKEHRPQGSKSLKLPAKNLLGIPWRLALALQADGWILRNDIIWNKPNAMPESVTDRLSNRHEHIFMFTKSQRYHFDLDPVRAPLIRPEAKNGKLIFGGRKGLQQGTEPRRTGKPYGKRNPEEPANGVPGQAPHHGHRGTHEKGKNPGDVWNIATKPFKEAHFATFPVELPKRCIQAGCKPGGTVLDPFSGSGTTGLAAQLLGRRYVGIDISADYLELSLRTRFADATIPLD